MSSDYQFLYDPTDESNRSYDVEIVESECSKSDNTAQFPLSSHRSDIGLKWQVIAEKLGIRIILQQLQNQAEQIALILNSQRKFHHQVLANAFTPFPSYFTQIERAKQHRSQKSNIELVLQVQSQINTSWQSLSEFLKSDRQVVHELAKERDKNSFSREHDYITELENQLSQTQKQYLQSKLQLSDSQDLSSQYKSQLDQSTTQLNLALLQKQQAEQSYQHLSHQLDQVTSEKMDLSNQLILVQQRPLSQSLESNQLQHQIQLLTRHEQVEQELCIQLDREQQEVKRLTNKIQQWQSDADKQQDALYKASMLVRKLDEQNQMQDSVQQQLLKDNQTLLQEAQQYKDQCQVLYGQIEQQEYKYQQMHQTMSDELSQLKHLVQDYQQQLRSFNDQNQDELLQKISQLKARVKGLNKVLQNKDQEHRLEMEAKCYEIVSLEDQLREGRERYLVSMDEVQQKQEGERLVYQQQIRFMQQSGVSTYTESLTFNHQQALVQSLQQDLVQTMQELLQLKTLIQKDIQPDSLADQTSLFSIIDQWQDSIAQLTKISLIINQVVQEYQGNYLKCKVVVQEKDQIIKALMGMRRQWDGDERGDLGLSKEQGLTIQLLQQVVNRKEQLMKEHQAKLEGFKMEFVKVVEERDFLLSKNKQYEQNWLKMDQESQLVSSQVRDLCSNIIGVCEIPLASQLLQLQEHFGQKCAHITSLHEKTSQLERLLTDQQAQFKQDLSNLSTQLELCYQEHEYDMKQRYQQWQKQSEGIEQQLKLAQQDRQKAVDNADLKERQFSRQQIRLEEAQQQYREINSQMQTVCGNRDELVRQLESVNKVRQCCEDELIQVQTKQRLDHGARLVLQQEYDQQKKHLESLQSSEQDLQVQLRECQLTKDMLERELVVLKQGSEQDNHKVQQLQYDYQLMFKEYQSVQKECYQFQNTSLVQQMDIDALIQQVQSYQQQQQQSLQQVSDWQEQNQLQERECEEQRKLILDLKSMVKKTPVLKSQITQTVLDFGRLQYSSELCLQENQQLRDILLQKQHEMQMLIEDKRELERSIYQFNKRTMITMDSSINEGNIREVLVEKDNYIQRLEGEIGLMRKEMMDSDYQ